MSTKDIYENAFIIAGYYNALAGPMMNLWENYIKNAWPTIMTGLNLPWVFPTIAIVFTAVNLVLVSFQTSGFNSVAVFFTIAKNVLRDQDLGNGITLYGFFDIVIEVFSTT